MKYGLQCSDERYADALATLNALPDTLNGMTTFKQVQYINLDRMQQGVQYDMPSGDSTYLETVAQSDAASGSYARGILSLLFDRSYSYAVQPPDTSGPQKQRPEVMEREKVRVYPNPASGQITVTMNDLSPAGLKVSSLTGRTVYEEPISEDESSVQIAVREWTNGVYFLHLEDERGRTVHSEKIFVDK